MGSVVVVHATYNSQNVSVFNIITKAAYNHKPTEDDFRTAMTNLFFALYLACCTELHVPLLGCGRDGQMWSRNQAEPGGDGRGRSGIFCVQDVVRACSAGVECTLHVHHQPFTVPGQDTCERKVGASERCVTTNVVVEVIYDQQVYTCSFV